MLNQPELRRIIDQLKSFGCSEQEAQIYLRSLEMGPSSVQEIARRMRRNRVTIHSAVEQLIEKQLLFETRRGKRRLIVAEEPVGLLRLLKKKENDLVSLRSNIENIIPLLASLPSIDQNLPTVRFFEGVDGFNRMLEETLSARGELLVFSYVDLFSGLIGPNNLERYFVDRAAKGIHSRLLFPTCPFAERVQKKEREYKIQIRTLPKTMVWKSGIFSWNDCLALLSYTQQHLTCTIIENRDIAEFFRKIIFELCWKGAE